MAPHQNKHVGGHPAVDWFSAVKAEFFPQHRFKKLLSVGCGIGLFERQLFQHDYFESGIGLELSPEALDIARAEQGAMPFQYIECDLNKGLPEEVKTGDFDFVVAMASMHHIENLERLLFQINRQMIPGGTFMFLEFCGPLRFQWDDKTLKICNAILDILPPSLKRHLTELKRPTYSEGQSSDPSEAVRGREIMDMTRLCL